jgi:hypothetical protein
VVAVALYARRRRDLARVLRLTETGPIALPAGRA